MKKAIVLFTLVILTLSCSSDDNPTPVEQPTPVQVDNILFIHADPNSLNTYYEMQFNGEIIQDSTTPNSGTQHKVINAQYLTIFKIHAIHATQIDISLNSSARQLQLDENSCYELTFTTDAQSIAIIDDFIKVDCQD